MKSQKSVQARRKISQFHPLYLFINLSNLTSQSISK